MDQHVAIIGAGQAGASLALRLRAGGFGGPITIYGEEAWPPYQRPPLSKRYLSGEWPADRLSLKPPQAWRELGVEIVTQARVEAIDPERRRLRVGGVEVGWSKLALTTGTRPRPTPPQLAGIGGVHVLRAIADVEALRPHFAPGRRALIVGGGYVGLETAAVAAGMGLHVTVVERAGRILERVACEDASRIVRTLHQRHGVRIVEGRVVVAAHGGERLSGVTLDDGERLDVDFAVVGVGVAPRDELARAAGLDCRDGVLVDGHGRTGAPGVWAAGDCANFPLHGERVRLESVQNAVDQAECAADDMLGRSRLYAPTPWFWSDQYDMKLQMVGLARGADATVRLRSGQGESLWRFAGGTLVGVTAINDSRIYMAARKLLESGRAPSLEEASREGFDPVAWLKRGGAPKALATA